MPRFSIILAVKDAAPLVRGCVEAIRSQRELDFEVIVYDGRSSDETVALLESGLAGLDAYIVSEPDASLAEAYAKGLQASSGDIVHFAAADERLLPDSLSLAGRYFDQFPETACVAGDVAFMNEEGRRVDRFTPPGIDLRSHLSCSAVWPVGSSFFNRRVIASGLRLRHDVPSCPDYELIARLLADSATRSFERLGSTTTSAYRTQASMSFRPTSIESLVNDKLFYLNSLFDSPEFPYSSRTDHNYAARGICVWGAEMALSVGAPASVVASLLTRAIRFSDGQLERGEVLRKFPDCTLVSSDDSVVIPDVLAPPPNARVTEEVGTWTRADSPSATLNTDESGAILLTTCSDPWGYSLGLNHPPKVNSGEPRQWWVGLTMHVTKGRIGVGVLNNNELRQERLFWTDENEQEVFFSIRDSGDSLIIRSGGEGCSVVRIMSHLYLTSEGKEEAS